MTEMKPPALEFNIEEKDPSDDPEISLGEGWYRRGDDTYFKTPFYERTQCSHNPSLLACNPEARVWHWNNCEKEGAVHLFWSQHRQTWMCGDWDCNQIDWDEYEKRKASEAARR